MLSRRTIERLRHLKWFGGLTAEQVQFREVARDFSRKEFLPYGRQWEEDEHFSIPVLQKAAGLGICVDNDVGGCGLGALDAAVVFEELAYGDIPTTAFLTIQNMVATVIDRYGTAEQRSMFLPPLMKLEYFVSYCLTEPDSGSDAASLKTTAKKQISSDTNSYVLNGSKAFISGGGLSQIYLVMARTGADGASGISAFIVRKDTKGMGFGKEEEKMGWRSHPTTAVFFDDVEGQLIGNEGKGFSIAMQALDRGRINIAACAVGGAQFCLESAEAYVRARHQFNKPLIAFQNTQFVLAEMATQIHASRLMVHQAARSVDNKMRSATMEAAMAKMYATEMAVDISNHALQLLGGYGYLKDYDIERYVRDLRVMTILEGTNEIMKRVIQKERNKAID